MADLVRAATDLRTAHDLIQGLGATGFAGVDANVEAALTYLQLALAALGADVETSPAEGPESAR